MEFWDFVEDFHSRVGPGHRFSKEGLQAIQYIRAMMKPFWKEEYATKHPIREHLLVAGDIFYFGLIMMREKLQVAETLVGFDGIRKRLAVPKEFDNAWSEVDTAFRFHIAGVPVEFVPTTQTEQSPDLKLVIGSEDVWVEVTSVNPASEDRVSLILNQIFRMSFMHKVRISGVISNPHNFRAFTDFESKLQKAVIDAKTNNREVTINSRGVYTFRVRPQEMKAPSASDDEGIFVGYSGHRPHIERIQGALREKTGKEYHRRGNWYLVLIDRLMNDDEFVRLLASDTGEVSGILSTYPDVIGMTVLIPAGVNNPQIPSSALGRKDRRLSVYAIPPYDTEAYVEWENLGIVNNHSQLFSEVFRNYPRNLEGFLKSRGLEWR